MDSRFQPKTIASRPAAQRMLVEHYGNVAKLRFDLRPDLGRRPTSAWSHDAAITDESERRSH